MQLPFSRAPRTSLVSCCPSARPAKRCGPAACGSWTVPGPPPPGLPTSSSVGPGVSVSAPSARGPPLASALDHQPPVGCESD